MNNILVCIISCQKNKELWNEYLEKEIDNLIIVCGDSNLKQLYKLDNKVLYVNCSDAYCGLCEKIIFTINAILDIEKYKGITHLLKIDDDNFFTKENIIKLSQNLIINKYHYIGQKTNISNYDKLWGSWHFKNTKPENYWFKKKYIGKPNISYSDGGESYIISKMAMEKIKKYYGFYDLGKIRREHIYEDYMIGEIMNYYKIKPYYTRYGIYGDKLSGNYIPFSSQLIIYQNKLLGDYINFYSKPLIGKSIILICFFKNEYPLLDYFISYYRDIGITHFIFINNNSNDYSLRYIRHLKFKYPSSNYLLFNINLNETENYQEKKNMYINFVLQRYCINMWTLLVNIDEILDLSNYNNHISYLIDDMIKTNSIALKTLLINMYPINITQNYQRGEPFIDYSYQKRDIEKKTKIILFFNNSDLINRKIKIDNYNLDLNSINLLKYKLIKIDNHNLDLNSINLLKYKYINICYLFPKLEKVDMNTELKDLHIKYSKDNKRLIDLSIY